MKTKICCVTGNRKIDKEKIESTKQKIRKCVIEVINDGYTHFISGFEDGIELYFVEIIVELKKEHHLTLEANIPYRNRMKTKNHNFQKLMMKCDIVNIISDKYTTSCVMKRNRFMVQASDLLIAVYDGQERGSSFFTICYARALEKNVKIINIV